MFHSKKINKEKYELTKQEFDKIKDKALLLDVRELSEYQTLQTIENSINVPLRKLIAEPEKYIPSKKTLVVTICNAGNRATVAVKALREQGYTNSYVLMSGVYGYYKEDK